MLMIMVVVLRHCHASGGDSRADDFMVVRIVMMVVARVIVLFMLMIMVVRMLVMVVANVMVGMFVKVTNTKSLVRHTGTSP